MILSDKACLHALVRGQVQGVCFRAFVSQRAGALGVTGWVRNGADGSSVEVSAEGPRKSLEELLAALAEGPPAALVSSVERDWQEYRGRYRGFIISR